MIIDCHAHFVPPAFLDEMASGRRSFPSVKVVMENGGYRFAFAGNDAKRPVPNGMSDAGKRQQWLNAHGIDKQVVGGWLDVFGYDVPADEGADWSRYFNEYMLNGVKAHPFLVPLATVPMQSGKHAAKVLEEALDAGFPGAMIGTQPKGATGVLDDPDLDPFWEAASRRKATLFVHPTFGAPDERLKAYGLVSAVGRVTDTTIAISRLLYSGHLVRYPGVSLVISHGGAALPMVLGRLRRSFATAPAQNKDPDEGFKRLYFDTIVYDTATLRFIAEQAGPDKVLMGTDLPFTIAEPEPVQFVDAAGFTGKDRAAILGGTAARLFNVGASAPGGGLSIMSGPANGTGIGQPVRRREDLRLLTGQGRYTDDQQLPDQAYAVMLRSPHAHARIRGVDKTAALAVPGVIAVLTGQDWLDDGMKPTPIKTFSWHPAEIPLHNTDGSPAFTAPDFPLPHDKARFAGEAVALVVAETIAAARDGAEAVGIDYEPLPCVTLAPDAAKAGAPLLHEHHGSNVCIDALAGDAAATAAAFGRAAHVARLRTWVPRVTGSPMEPRAALGEYDPAAGKYTIHTCNGSVRRLHGELAAALGVPDDKVRLVIRDVGGNFGTRGQIFAEQMLVAWAARKVGRPVKWTSDRSEAFLSDYQGRDLSVDAELALDAEGNFLAMRGDNVGNLGARTGNYSMVQKGVEIMSSIYRVPAAHFRARCVMSNTAPTRPYRSAGRPEVMFVVERLIDIAARQFGFDRVELRRRNLVPEHELPYRNPFGMVYDSGAYHAVMDKALELADWNGFPARKAQARREGRYRGIGISNYVDTATGIPRERAEVTVRPDGQVEVVIGTVSNGQGHETSFAQLLNEWLGVPIENVRLITGDTDIVKVGGGTHSGRGMRLGSIVLWKSSQAIVETGRRVAALLLQAQPDAIGFHDGHFTAAPTGNSITLAEVARAMSDRADLPPDLRGPLQGECDETVKDAAFPYGCHVCEVEIDPDTGTWRIVQHTGVDDAGRAVNPMIIHGQTHGGMAQGIGQALLEHCFYDADTGQLLSGTFMDYAMPRAGNMPSYTTEISEVPSTTHPLGMRPAGEGGTTPALGVVINAIVDALSEFGVDHIEMPATPERIWRAMRGLPQRSRSEPDGIEREHFGRQ